MAASLEISAAGCCVCQRPVSCSRPLQTHCYPSDVLSPFLFWHLFVRSLFSLPLSLSLFPTNLPSPRICNIPAVSRDPAQSDGVLGFDASFGCGLSRREGQGGVGEGARGGEEEGPQTHRDGKTKSRSGEAQKK